MEARYIVLNIGRMSEDYSEKVCNALRNSRLFGEGKAIGDFQKEPNICARFVTKEEFFTNVDVYLNKFNSPKGESSTLIELSRYIEEPLEESEEIILRVRRELSSLLLNKGLIIH